MKHSGQINYKDKINSLQTICETERFTLIFRDCKIFYSIFGLILLITTNKQISFFGLVKFWVHFFSTSIERRLKLEHLRHSTPQRITLVVKFTPNYDKTRFLYMLRHKNIFISLHPNLFVTEMSLSVFERALSFTSSLKSVSHLT